MRNTFITTLTELAKNDKSIILMTGDLGFGVLDKFRNIFPDQFINAGISEQNMTSVAAGMAIENKKVYTYSIGNFPSLRCLEQVRNDILYHKANVKIVSIGAGVAYGGAGISHHATEDIAILRSLPGITIFSPCDKKETAEITKAANSIIGPCYLRLGKGGEHDIHDVDIDFQVGNAKKIISGDDVAIFSTGSIIFEALKAINKLKSANINASLYSFSTIKPIDKDTIINCSNKYSYIVTLEEHNILGGLGGAVAEVMAENSGKAILRRIGLKDTFASIVGTQEYLRKQYNIDSEFIYDVVISLGKK